MIKSLATAASLLVVLGILVEPAGASPPAEQGLARLPEFEGAAGATLSGAFVSPDIETPAGLDPEAFERYVVSGASSYLLETNDEVVIRRVVAIVRALPLRKVEVSPKKLDARYRLRFLRPNVERTTIYIDAFGNLTSNGEVFEVASGAEWLGRLWEALRSPDIYH